MTVQIKVRGDNGKYVHANASEFTLAALDQMEWLSPDRWQWMRDWIARWCLRKATETSGDTYAADRWIERYRAIRGIE